MTKWVWRLADISDCACDMSLTFNCHLFSASVPALPVVRMQPRGSCRAGPCARHGAASHTSSPAWVTRCPAATPATPATAASSMPSATAAGSAMPAHRDSTSHTLLGSWTTPLIVCCLDVCVIKELLLKLHWFNSDFWDPLRQACNASLQMLLCGLGVQLQYIKMPSRGHSFNC